VSEGSVGYVPGVAGRTGSLGPRSNSEWLLLIILTLPLRLTKPAKEGTKKEDRAYHQKGEHASPNIMRTTRYVIALESYLNNHS